MDYNKVVCNNFQNCFYIIIYSIFMGVVGEPLASVADTVFVAAIIGSFTLVGTIVGRGLLKK